MSSEADRTKAPGREKAQAKPQRPRTRPRGTHQTMQKPPAKDGWREVGRIRQATDAKPMTHMDDHRKGVIGGDILWLGKMTTPKAAGSEVTSR